MKVKEFVDGFTKATDKEKYVKKHIVRTYVNYAQKISECKKIALVSMYQTDNKGVSKFYIDTPMRYMLFIVTIIRDYTDIEFDDKNVPEGFDLLNESGADSCVISFIKDDFDMFKSVLDMVVNDIIDRERNLIDYIDGKLSAFSTLIDSLNLEEVLKNAEYQSDGDTTT